MITWFTDSVATCAYMETPTEAIRGGKVADVRDLVDRTGNAREALAEHVDRAVGILEAKGTVYIACDAGISRSRVIALGVLVHQGWEFADALRHIRQVAENPEINLGLLRELTSALSFDTVQNEALDTTRVLLLGSSGFLGRHLKLTLNRDYDVYSPTHNDLDLGHDAAELDRLVGQESCGIIVNAASPVSHHSASALGKSLVMTKNVLDVARAHGVRVIVFSDLVVFAGNARAATTESFRATDRSQPIPYGTYSETKYLAETLVDHFRDSYGVAATTIRPGALYGPEMRGSWLIPKLVAKAISDEPMNTHRYLNGLPAFDFLHVNDLAAAMLALLKAEDLPSKVNVGSGELTSTRELAQRIVRLADSESTIGTTTINDHTSRVTTETSGVWSRNGWHPVISLDDGLAELINLARREQRKTQGWT